MGIDRIGFRRVREGNLTFIVDGDGAVPTTGAKEIYREMPFSGVITSARMYGDVSGSAVVDVWKCTYAEFDGGATHPVDGDSITASAPPTISSSTKSQDTTLTGWTTEFSKGDILAINLDSISTITKLTLILNFKKRGE
jgi:hypothetical protein